MSPSDHVSLIDVVQRRASDPKASAFVAANAGSGKTYVLVSRILRLLIEGCDPSRILALTYTTAAAANMANRVFRDLSDWVGLDDGALAERLIKLDGTRPDADRLRRARRLFARAIETPGGLKIQTIHAFCERVLHLFPFEANVPAQFDMLDEPSRDAMLTEILQAVIHEGIAGADPDLAGSVDRLIGETGLASFEATIRMALGVADRIRAEAADPAALDALMARVALALGVPPDASVDTVRTEMKAGRIEDDTAHRMMGLLMASSANDTKLGGALEASLSASDIDAWEDAYFSVFFKSDGDPRAESRCVTKPLNDKHPFIRTTLLAEQTRLMGLIERRKAAACLARTRALLHVASAVIARYEAAKIRRGALDFNDLIARTRALLQRAGAHWVLYKLDSGIDHLLVDEAQDTSPEQWDILRRLTEEFHAGAGARSGTRTVFAVGDPKQSIFSFQGADPAEFARSSDYFAARMARNDEAGARSLRFHAERLTVSFRSAPDILAAVDAVFAIPAHYAGLETPPEPTVHQSQRQDAPGRVELWPIARTERADPPESWTAPIDEPGENAPPVKLARQIAAHIARLVAPGSPDRIAEGRDGFRPIRPGDVLILVRKRGVFFDTMIRALKNAGLPVAGADRLKLQSHIAVMDLVALGEAMLTPEDDLTLATVLRSPLFGFDEAALLALAAGRSGSLVTALSGFTGDARIERAARAFEDLQAVAAREGPFGFYAHVLGPGQGRAAIHARLGAEADDAIDEFLRLALEHDHGRKSSLALFLGAFREAEIEIKRDMESGRDEVRVMTVHGAKGLEAPIVYLPDTTASSGRAGDDTLFDLDLTRQDWLPAWSPAKALDSAPVVAAREAAAELDRQEHRRLLYVALTRPRDRLYITGYANRDGAPAGSWYAMVETALNALLVPVPDDGLQPEGARRLENRAWPADADGDRAAPAPAAIPALPAWLSAPAPTEAVSFPPIKPSDALEAADRTDRPVEDASARAARQRGLLIHALLETLPDLPETGRASAADAYLAARGEAFSEAERKAMVEGVLALLARPELAPLFGPASRAEAPIAGTLTRPGRTSRPVSGQIDRIAVLEDCVIVADYKTATRAPTSQASIAERHVAQLAAYRALVSALYPDRPVRCLIVYTASLDVFEISAERLDAALDQIA